MKRLFDARCSCDEDKAEEAKAEWKERMSIASPASAGAWASDPLWVLQRRVRELCSGWGRGLPSMREGSGEDPVYTPDQQGCLERPRGDGGTLAVPYSEEQLASNIVRVGAAKTKGKLRVVTMQGSRVKRVLSPVHNALYDYLSSFGWLVRGDVKKADFQAVEDDKRDGEFHISGDYTAATDNIHMDAVEAIVKVLLEDGRLTDEEACTLKESFAGIRWFNPCTGVSGPINRGSMMGNLVSFPLLCLLNKACYDITCDLYFGAGTRRIGRFNGDDCCFNGTAEFYQLWREVTATFGLVVNESKTSFTSRFIELNSHTYWCQTRRIIDKPVLSFLRRREDVPDCIISDIFSGTAGFRDSTVWWIVSTLMRYEILIRQTSLNSIPKRWRKPLLRRRWFRDSFRRDPTPVRDVGVERTVKVVLGPPPKDKYYPLVDRWARRLGVDSVVRWKGVSVRPRSKTIDRRALRPYLSRFPRARTVWAGSLRWRFLWPEWLYELFPASGLLTDRECLQKWVTDHKFLHLEAPALFPDPRPFFYPPPVSLLPSPPGISWP